MHGGVVFQAGKQLSFVPATIALKVIPTPAIARVPGGPPELRGVALVDGDMIAIFAVGADAERASTGGLASPRAANDATLICSVLGEQVGLVGIQIVATGRFEAADGADVRVGAEIARAFDVASLIAKVRDGRWGATLSE